MKNAILISWVFSLMFVGAVSATIIDIPADQPNIQAGINASTNGDTVRVTSGTYVENIDFSGKNIVVGSWFLDAGDTSFISSTIIDGNQSESVVSFLNGEDNSAVITGFTIQNGFATFGGGIYCDGSSPTISNNTISGNSANSRGGGINCDDSSPTINYNTISGNSAGDMGGGIFCTYSSPTISNNTISGNSAGDRGGGIFCHYSNSMISNNTISGNSAGSYGGGICCWDNSSPTIINNTISENSATQGGGGIGCYYSSNPTISNNTISGNSIFFKGGGIYCASYSNPTINYNTISGNSASHQGEGSGGGLYWASSSNSAISNNTISGNSADEGGGIYCHDSSPVITNTIFWGDSAPTEPEIFLDGASSPVITYCDVQGGWAGNGNIDCDPMFCYPDPGNYYLAENSCCVGAGQGGVDIGALGIGCGMRYMYLPGDANMYNGIWPPQCIGSDVTYLVNYFRGVGDACELDGFWCTADANGDCNVIGSDVTRLVNYFRGNVSLLYCPDYEPLWLTPDDLPDEAPDGWPNCETPVINNKIIPTGSVK